MPQLCPLCDVGNVEVRLYLGPDDETLRVLECTSPDCVYNEDADPEEDLEADAAAKEDPVE